MTRSRLLLGATLPLAAVALAAALLTPGRRYQPPEDAVPIPSDPASLSRGKHLVDAIAVCTICHGDDLGGKLAFDDPFLGHGYTANLTAGRGGIGERYRARDWVRSIRYGVRPDGSAIRFMPSDHYNAISTPDLGAMISYLATLPPVDNTRTAVELGPWAKLLIGVGSFGQVNRTALIDFAAPRPTFPSAGAYIAAVAGCSFCHGPTMAGGQGPEPGAPAAPDLRHLSQAQFVHALRTGVASDGHAIQPKYMPWLGYRSMSDSELTILWQFIRRET